jgi:hypothetical protein
MQWPRKQLKGWRIYIAQRAMAYARLWQQDLLIQWANEEPSAAPPGKNNGQSEAIGSSIR